MHLLGPFSGVGEELLEFGVIAEKIVFRLGFQLADEGTRERWFDAWQFASFGETIEERRIVAVPQCAQRVEDGADVGERS